MNNYTADSYIKGPKIYDQDPITGSLNVSYNTILRHMLAGAPVFIRYNDYANQHYMTMCQICFVGTENDTYIAVGVAAYPEELNPLIFEWTSSDPDAFMEVAE